MKVLISGFEPFDGLDENPSEQLVHLLLEEDLGFELSGLVLPVSFKISFALLKEQIDLFHPDFVVGFGLAGIRDELTPERVAINLVEARIPDNQGYQPVGERVTSGQPDGVFTDLPIKSMVEASQRIGIKSSVSNTAGTYICNYLMFKVIQYGKQKGYRGGFIHVPPTPDIVKGSGTMPLGKIKAGVVEMLKVISSDEQRSMNTGVEC